MKKNCRNCKHAKWYRNALGRKSYGNWAECKADVSQIIKLLPASIRGKTFELTAQKTVVYGNEELNCPAWEKELK